MTNLNKSLFLFLKNVTIWGWKDSSAIRALTDVPKDWVPVSAPIKPSAPPVISLGTRRTQSAEACMHQGTHTREINTLFKS